MKNLGSYWRLEQYDEDVFFYKSKKAIKADLARLKDKDLDPGFIDTVAGCVAIVPINGSRAIFLGVFDKSDKTLVHEITHLAAYIVEWKNLEFGADHAEPVCYLMESIFQAAKERGL